MLGGCKKNGKMNLGRGIFLGNSYLILGLIIKMLRIFIDKAHFVREDAYMDAFPIRG